MSKYNNLMDNIVVSEDMKNRILQNIEKELDSTENNDKIVNIESITSETLKNKSNSGKISNMRWVNLAAAAAVLVVSGIAVRNVVFNPGSSEATYNNAVKTEMKSDSIYPADRSESEAAAEEALAEDEQYAEEASVEAVWDSQTYASVDELSAAVGFTVKECTSVDAENIEYRSIGKDLAQITYTTSDNEICFRQMQGTVDFIDISGDYEQYADVIDEDTDGITVTLRGSADSFKSATWFDGTSTVVIRLENSVSQNELIETVKKFLM